VLIACVAVELVAESAHNSIKSRDTIIRLDVLTAIFQPIHVNVIENSEDQFVTDGVR